MYFHYPLLLAAAFVALAQTGDVDLRIPPARVSFDAGGQPVTVTVWGSLSKESAELFRLNVTADLGDFQQNVTPLLRSQLNRSDRCGERMSVERADLAPAAPDSVLAATVHYERWGCVKAFGKEVTKRVVGGNGILKVKLTPVLDANAISLRSEVIGIEADGSLGELLRSGSTGDALTEKIAASVRSAIEKSATFNSVLPPEISNAVTIRSVEFTSCREGRLCIETVAEARISPDRLKLLGKQLASR
jgi:hypothetical protein